MNPEVNLKIKTKSETENFSKKKATNFIEIDRLDDVLERMIRHGGKVLQPKKEIPGIGYIAVCTDHEENIHGFMEIKKS